MVKPKSKSKKKTKTSYLEDHFFSRWKRRYPEISLQSEYKFHSVRKFRLDFAHIPAKVGIEINGGIWMPRSGHNSGNGLRSDYQKTCEASALGWALFPLSKDMLDDDHWLDLIAQTILSRAAIG